MTLLNLKSLLQIRFRRHSMSIGISSLPLIGRARRLVLHQDILHWTEGMCSRIDFLKMSVTSYFGEIRRQESSYFLTKFTIQSIRFHLSNASYPVLSIVQHVYYERNKTHYKRSGVFLNIECCPPDLK